jgi:hypothetical protein
MTELSKKILQKIEKENIKPYPKEYFWFKRSVVWLLFGISVLLGAISSGLVIYHLGHAEWDLYPQLNQSLLEFLLMVVPYLWIIFLIVFAYLVYHYFRKTERGYRYSAVIVISMSIILSIIGGILFYSFEVPQKMDTLLENKVPFYKGLQKRKKEFWISPQNGLLAGKIIQVLPEQKVQLEDFNGKLWLVDISQASWRGRLSERKGAQIKIIGKMINDGIFNAKEIRPWLGKGRKGKHRGQRYNR